MNNSDKKTSQYRQYSHGAFQNNNWNQLRFVISYSTQNKLLHRVVRRSTWEAKRIWTEYERIKISDIAPGYATFAFAINI